MRPKERVRMLVNEVAAHVEYASRDRCRSTSRHCSSVMLVQHGIACDAGVVDQDVDGTEGLGDLGHALGAGVEVTNVPFVDRDAGFDLELLSGSVLPA